MKVFHCEVCGAQLTPEEVDAQPAEAGTPVVRYCARHRPGGGTSTLVPAKALPAHGKVGRQSSSVHASVHAPGGSGSHGAARHGSASAAHGDAQHLHRHHHHHVRRSSRISNTAILLWLAGFFFCATVGLLAWANAHSGPAEIVTPKPLSPKTATPRVIGEPTAITPAHAAPTPSPVTTPAAEKSAGTATTAKP